VQVPNREPEVPQLDGEGPVEIGQPSDQKTHSKLRGILKDSGTRINRKPTVEEVSDAEADSMVEPRSEPYNQQTSRLPRTFAEPNRAPSTRPFGSDSDDEKPTRFARAAVIPESKKSKKPTKSSLPMQQTKTTNIFSGGDENQGYWDIINQGLGAEQQQGDASESAASSSNGKHAVWRPPVFHDDSADEDEDGGLFHSLAFGASMPVDDMSSAPWAGGGMYQRMPASMQYPKEKIAMKPDPRSRNGSKGAPRGTGWEGSPQNGMGEPQSRGDTEWEAAMMGKFYEFAHSSANYA
jgi:hypothetical protein